MQNTFKRTFQPLEIAVKKALGIRKKHKGQIFNSQGFAIDSREKITRYILFLPLFQKVRILTIANEISAQNGGNSTKSTLYTIKTHYKIFGITIWRKITTRIHKSFALSIRATIGDNDWTNIGKYVATNPNIMTEILALIKGLDKDSKNFVLRQIALSLKAYKSNESVITDLTKQEIAEIIKEREEFFPNIFKLSDNIYCYDSYLLPTDAFSGETFFYKYNLNVLQPQTLAKMRSKDFIDAGGYIGDTAIKIFIVLKLRRQILRLWSALWS